MKKGIIDRFEKGVEGYFAIIELEDREILIVEKSEFFNNKKEGDEVEVDEFNNIC